MGYKNLKIFNTQTQQKICQTINVNGHVSVSISVPHIPV